MQKLQQILQKSLFSHHQRSTYVLRQPLLLSVFGSVYILVFIVAVVCHTLLLFFESEYLGDISILMPVKQLHNIQLYVCSKNYLISFQYSWVFLLFFNSYYRKYCNSYLLLCTQSSQPICNVNVYKWKDWVKSYSHV